MLPHLCAVVLPLVAVPLAGALRAQAPVAQVPSVPAEQALATARATYEQAMAEVRTQVLAEIGAAKADVKTRQDWRDRFREAGEWPRLDGNSRLAGLQAQAAAAHRAMDAAYEACLEAVFDDEALAKIVRAEWDQWHRVADLAAWQSLPLPAARDGSCEAPELLPLFAPKGPYRLDVRGRCRPDATPLLLLPGQREPVAVLHDKGQFRIVVTVGPDDVVANDLGLRRGAVTGVDAPRAGKEVALLAASCTIELLQWKPAPVDVERLALADASRLEKAAADTAEAKAAARSAADQRIAALERKKRDPATRIPGIESKLTNAEQNVKNLTAQIERERRKGHDTSELETDCKRWRGIAADHRRSLDQLRAEIAKYDEDIERLRKQ